MYRVALSTVLLAGGLVAQDSLYLTGFSDSGGPLGPTGNSYPVGRFKDLDKDGTINDSTELFAFLKVSYNTRNGTGSFMADVTWIKEGDGYAFYFADSGDGRITRGVDQNHNGLLDNSEVTEYYDLMTGFAPEGITARVDPGSGKTIVYVANDDQANSPGIHRMVDLNGDGDAFDAGEHTMFVDASKGLSVPGKTGTVTLSNDWWFSLHTLPNGKILAYNAGPSKKTGGGSGQQGPENFCWYELTDNNGTASVAVFFNPSQMNGIATHTDFAAGGKFPQWDIVLDPITVPSLHPMWSDIPFVTEAINTTPGPKVYYFGSSYRDQMTGGFSGTNPAGQLVSGLIYRWTDLDGNSVIGANEITLFANFTNTTVAGIAPAQFLWSGSQRPTLDNNIFGMEARDGKLHLCWDSRTTAAKGILTMGDANSNGVIETGEAVQTYAWSGAQSPTNPVYHLSFGPFVKGFSSFDRGFMPGPFPPGLDPYGSGCPLPLTGLSPLCDAAGGEPKVGSSGFEVAVIRAIPNLSTQFVFIGFGRVSIPLTFLGLPANCALLLNPLEGFGPIPSDGSGVASLGIPIPNNPALVSRKVNFQWLVNDPSAALPYRTSNALEVTIQP